MESQEWSEEMKILSTPTPVDINASADRHVKGKEAREEHDAFLPELEAVVTSINEEGDNDTFFGGSGMIALNELMDMALDELNGREPFYTSYNHAAHPQGYEAYHIVEAFQNPASLVDKFGKFMDMRERQYASYAGKYGDYDRVRAVEVMERLAAVIYGDRWRVYKETLDVAEESQEGDDSDAKMPLMLKHNSTPLIGEARSAVENAYDQQDGGGHPVAGGTHGSGFEQGAQVFITGVFGDQEGIFNGIDPETGLAVVASIHGEELRIASDRLKRASQ